MRASLVVNRRCGFRSARISNAAFDAAILDASSRDFRVNRDKMLLLNRVCHTV
jgi:hypothetical protein